MLPFDTGARRKRGFSRAIAPGTSGQAGSTCQARLSARRVSSPTSAMPKRGRMRSRLRRCAAASFENRTRPDRPSRMARWPPPHAGVVLAAVRGVEGWPIEGMAELREDALALARDAGAERVKGAAKKQE